MKRLLPFCLPFLFGCHRPPETAENSRLQLQSLDWLDGAISIGPSPRTPFSPNAVIELEFSDHSKVTFPCECDPFKVPEVGCWAAGIDPASYMCPIDPQAPDFSLPSYSRFGIQITPESHPHSVRALLKLTSLPIAFRVFSNDKVISSGTSLHFYYPCPTSKGTLKK